MPDQQLDLENQETFLIHYQYIIYLRDVKYFFKIILYGVYLGLGRI